MSKIFEFKTAQEKKLEKKYPGAKRNEVVDIDKRIEEKRQKILRFKDLTVLSGSQQMRIQEATRKYAEQTEWLKKAYAESFEEMLDAQIAIMEEKIIK